MTATVSTQDQLAASRMLTARLHVALKALVEAYDSEPPDLTPATSKAVDEARAALEHNEPEIHALRTDAERAAREAARLGEARTHGARVQTALMAVMQLVDAANLDDSGKAVMMAAMTSITSSDVPVARLAADIKAVAAGVLAMAELSDNASAAYLREPAERLIAAFGPLP